MVERVLTRIRAFREDPINKAVLYAAIHALRPVVSAQQQACDKLLLAFAAEVGATVDQLRHNSMMEDWIKARELFMLRAIEMGFGTMVIARTINTYHRNVPKAAERARRRRGLLKFPQVSGDD